MRSGTKLQGSHSDLYEETGPEGPEISVRSCVSWPLSRPCAELWAAPLESWRSWKDMTANHLSVLAPKGSAPPPHLAALPAEVPTALSKDLLASAKCVLVWVLLCASACVISFDSQRPSQCPHD